MLEESVFCYGGYNNHALPLEEDNDYREFFRFSASKRIAVKLIGGVWEATILVTHYHTLTKEVQDKIVRIHSETHTPSKRPVPPSPTVTPKLNSDGDDSEHLDPHVAQIQGGRPPKRRRNGGAERVKVGSGKLSASQKIRNLEQRQEKKQSKNAEINAALTAKYSKDQIVITIQTLEKPTSSISPDLIRMYARKVTEIMDDCTNLADGSVIDGKHIITFLARGKSWVAQAHDIGHLLSKHRHSKNLEIMPWLTGEPDEPISKKMGMSSFLKAFKHVLKKNGEGNDMAVEESSGDSD